jgi:hypothetical protein
MKQAGQLLQETDHPCSRQRFRNTGKTLAERTAESSLLLAGQVIHAGDVLSLRVFGSWITGQVEQDYTGWYLLTAAQVGIRLSAGLTVRWERGGQREEEEQRG